MRTQTKRDAGIAVRHSRGCRSRDGGGCNCTPTYQAHVWSQRDGKRVRKTFATKTEAKLWRSEALVALDKGAMRAPTPETVRDAAEAWLDGARAGTIRNRSRDPYKPGAIRSYERALRLRVLPALGDARLSDVRLTDVQDMVDAMVADGLSASTIDTTLNPLRAIYRRAMARGFVAVNPTRGLELPANRGRRDRIAAPDEAQRLLAALPERDRPIWATAMYAGLRRGELMAMDWTHIDLASGLIHVERSWDDVEGLIGLKSSAGKRNVPIPAVLRDYLDEHRLRSAGTGLAFGNGPDPFNPKTLIERADRAWRDAGLKRITLHECRHTFASMMIAAGVNAKALSTYMGHANIGITLDRYGHLMPGNEGEAAALLDAYLERADTAARLAQVGDA